MRSYLVVANQTLEAEQVLEKIGTCLTEGPCKIHFLVPATPPEEGLTYTGAEAESGAHERLHDAIVYFRDRGFEVTGEIGDANPADAVHDVLDRERFDEVILSTFPAGASKWLKLDLPSRIERLGVPLTHFETEPEVITEGFHTP